MCKHYSVVEVSLKIAVNGFYAEGLPACAFGKGYPKIQQRGSEAGWTSDDHDCFRCALFTTSLTVIHKPIGCF